MRITNNQIDHKEIRIETTNRCNAKCIMCPREKMTRARTEMDFDHFTSLVDQAKDLGIELVSVFGYGEPLLDSKIIERIQYCTDRGLDTFITTNASLLYIDTAKSLLEAGLKHIRFSVHAIKSTDYESVHRGLIADDVNRNIQNFMAFNCGRCVVHVTTIPFHGESVELFKTRWEDADHLEVWRPHNWASGRKFRQTDRHERVKCMRCFTGPIQILSDGRMVVCCFDYDGKLNIGDTHRNSIAAILENSILLRGFRKLHKKGILSGLICDRCDQRFVYEESPLLYSTEQEGKELNKTSITKTDLVKEKQDGLFKTKNCGVSCTG